MELKFGEYVAIRSVGKGGMSEVYEVENPRLKSRHAVKVYAYPKDDPEVRLRFAQEGRLLVKLSHPRIVRVSDFGTTDDGRPYFVMDLVLNPDGQPQTLAELPAGSVDEDTIARWYDDIREGLAYIHARGIIHRDLKLENIMVGPDGHVVLTDFGISHLPQASVNDKFDLDPVDTIVNIRDGKLPVMGSVGYMSPELEMGVPASPRSDWYALGVIVYRLLTGTWCDARTDLAATLGTFDPAWMQIVPKLLHANPSGRECPAFADTRRAMQEAEAADAEIRLEAERRRGAIARRVSWAASVLVALLSVLLLFGLWTHNAEKREWRIRLQRAGMGTNVPSFDSLFSIPSAAKAEETTDEKGNLIMPSRDEFDAARVDALVLTQPIFSSLANGSLTFERAVSELESMAEDLEEDSNSSPLSDLQFGGMPYMQHGDNEALRRLLLQAAERLGAWSEMK